MLLALHNANSLPQSTLIHIVNFLLSYPFTSLNETVHNALLDSLGKDEAEVAEELLDVVLVLICH